MEDYVQHGKTLHMNPERVKHWVEDPSLVLREASKKISPDKAKRRVIYACDVEPDAQVDGAIEAGDENLEFAHILLFLSDQGLSPNAR